MTVPAVGADQALVSRAADEYSKGPSRAGSHPVCTDLYRTVLQYLGAYRSYLDRCESPHSIRPPAQVRGAPAAGPLSEDRLRRHQGLVLLSIATALLTSAIAVVPALGSDRWITVRAGDTLSQIALSEGVSVAQLVALNGLDNPNHIVAGQRLRVSVTPTIGTAPTPPPTVTPGTLIVHVVQPGESAWEIARRYEVSLQSLVSANQLANPSLIRPGQRLSIPGAQPAPWSQPAESAQPRQHRVAAGESVWSIARRYGVTVSAVVGANQLSNPSLIRIGQVLSIPASSGSAAGAPATTASMPEEMSRLVAARADVGRLIEAAARTEGVPVPLALALAWQESGWQQSAVSPAGAIGVMQITPPTADWVAGTMLHAPVDLWQMRSNLQAGLRLLHHYLNRYGRRDLALAAYYQGQTGTDRHGIYASSRPYVDSILALERLFSR